ncbi:hypothetical protein [Candidatus Methanoperedens nitratireducens]|uniref:Uncharacterized protein n=1 Tax=Candidatus Methanoperedens nitratireducens TaxID=1392998 RepID=A0A284VLA3_9EURY|nr:hypothetical protein [Candidatus Methanoperedens nitroreducens]SNQ59989.1 hypothetical protein MNV_1500003 [Candidatus Methanoperedens nitroreducens]
MKSRVDRLAEELAGLEEVKELYVTSDPDAAIVSRVSGDRQRIPSIQDSISSDAIRARGHLRRCTGSCSPGSLNKAVHIP